MFVCFMTVLYRWIVFQFKSRILIMAILIPVRVTCHENTTGSSQHISVYAAS